MTHGLKNEISPARSATGRARTSDPDRAVSWNHSLIEDLSTRESRVWVVGMRPCTEAATRPSASRTTVLGIERGLRVPAKDSSAWPSGE